MDLSQARSEPYVQFLDFHDRFNRQFKATVTALGYLRNTFADAPEKRGVFLEHMQRKWRDGHNWDTAGDVLRQASEDACRLAIAQIYSALDDFETLVAAEHSRWCGIANLPLPNKPIPAGGEHEPLWKLCFRLDLDHAELVEWRPLIGAFRVIRNCVVHCSSRATPQLVELSRSEDLKKLLKRWPRRKDRQPPPFPSFKLNSTISISPKTVILCLDSARRSAEAINRAIITFLGPAGLSYAAASHALLDGDLDMLPASYRTANSAIAATLASRYRVTSIGCEPEPLLRRLGCWEKCKRQHSKLYRAAITAGRFKLPQGFQMP